MDTGCARKEGNHWSKGKPEEASWARLQKVATKSNHSFTNKNWENRKTQSFKCHRYWVTDVTRWDTTRGLLTVGCRLQGRNHFLDTVHARQEKWNMWAGTFPRSLENLLLLKQPFKSLFNIPLTVVCGTLRRAPSKPAQESKTSHQTWT